jgi:DNA polymerase elongation subunit (family B)
MSKKKKVDHTGDRLVFDIEVSPAIYWLWRGGYGINVPTGNLIKEAAVICISYQWEGEDEIHTIQWDSKQNDKQLLKKFIPIMQQAGTLIGHNSDSFDIKWLRTRCLFHRLPCPPDFVTIDTWKQAKKFFRFQGNGLKYIAKFLGLEGKIEPEAGLWQKVVFDKDKQAMRDMIEYCERDVSQTMKVYEAFLPYVNTVGHKGSSMQDCAHCGSSNTQWEKDRISTAGAVKTQFRCKDCRKYGTTAASKWYNNTPIKNRKGTTK